MLQPTGHRVHLVSPMPPHTPIKPKQVPASPLFQVLNVCLPRDDSRVELDEDGGDGLGPVTVVHKVCGDPAEGYTRQLSLCLGTPRIIHMGSCARQHTFPHVGSWQSGAQIAEESAGDVVFVWHQASGQAASGARTVQGSPRCPACHAQTPLRARPR